jgi:hypothetical protein
MSKIFYNHSVDKNMTKGNDKLAQSAETRARHSKKNFYHVDILLKS